MKFFTFRIQEADLDALRQVAKEEGRSASAQALRFILAGIASHPEQKAKQG